MTQTLAEIDTYAWYGAPEQDWIVFDGIRCATGCLEAESNWYVARREMDLLCSRDWIIGYARGVSRIAAKPGSLAADIIQGLNDLLLDYPVIDGFDYSRRCYNRDCTQILGYLENQDQVDKVLAYLYQNDLSEEITQGSVDLACKALGLVD